nr:hypothetical protein BN444_01268 [Xanthomonas translucens pv. translucens DSM 18974]
MCGHGIVAIPSPYEPLTLPVNAQRGPLFTVARYCTGISVLIPIASR